jgi:hypothetical protein
MVPSDDGAYHLRMRRGVEFVGLVLVTVLVGVTVGRFTGDDAGLARYLACSSV